MKRSVLSGWLLLLASCGPSVEEHEALWASNGPTSYHYTYETSGFMAPLELLVTVRSRAVSSATVISPPERLGDGVQGFTVEQLFDDLRNRLGGPCKTTARYDEALGYPRSVYSDCGMEGGGWNVMELAAD